MNKDTKITERPPYGIIVVLMVGAFITFLNNTLLNIALPSIMNDLSIEPSTVQWLTTGFMLVNGVLIPTSAFLIQKFSVRHLFLIAMGLFTVGTITAGFAHTFPVLLTGRMIQAAGSAIMMPLLMNVMLISFPVEKRGAAMGVFGLILMFAPAIGPTLSGWIIEHYDWRMLFHFVTPIAILVVLLGLFLLKDKREQTNVKLDMFSVLLSSLGFGGLLYGFSSAGRYGWSSVHVYLTIIIGVIALTCFILRQFKFKEPMLNFSIFKYPMFALSSSISMVLNMAMFSGMLLLPIYVQTIRGISPMDAGLMMLPGALLMAFMSPVTGKLFDKYGGRVLAVTGLTITAVSTYYFSKLSYDTGYTYLMILHAIRMLGMSMVMMPVSTNGLNQLPKRFYPHGTAMNNTLNQVSGAIGTGLLITIMSNRQATYETELGSQALISADAQSLEQLPDQTLIQIKMEAMLGGINDAFLISGFIVIVAIILSIFIKRATPMEEPEAAKSARPAYSPAKGLQ